jgi:hypothetical protein
MKICKQKVTVTIMLPEKKLFPAARVKIVAFIGKSINELLKKKIADHWKD